MKLRELVGESWRGFDITSVITAGTAALCAGLLVGLTCGQGQALINEQTAREREGGGVVVIRAARDKDYLSGQGCEKFAAASGVESGGIVPGSHALRVWRLSRPVEVIDATPGLWRVWDLGPADGLLHTGAIYAEGGGPKPGTTLSDDDGLTAVVAGTLPRRGPDETQLSVVRMVRTPTVVYACFVRPPAGDREVVTTLAAWAYPKTPVTIKDFLPPPPEEGTPRARWKSYVSARPWLLAAAPACLVSLLAARVRRRDMAVYRSLGLGKGQTVAVELLRWLLALAPTLAAAVSVALVVARAIVGPLSGAVCRVGLVECAATVLVAAAAEVAACTWAASRSVISSFREG